MIGKLPTRDKALGPVLLFSHISTEYTYYGNKWYQIRTQFSRNNRLRDWYNFRLRDLQPANILEHLSTIFHEQHTVFKVNLSFAFILRNNETGQLRYYHASRNNHLVFPAPFLIAREVELQQVREALNNLDILEWARQQRDNSKWVVEQITNVTFFVTKLRGHPIGFGLELPPYLKNNQGLLSLIRNVNGKQYQDNLCFFRALALGNGCTLKTLEKATRKYFEKYRATHLGNMNMKDFEGVKLEDLWDLERLFEKNIFVYSLGYTREDGDDDDDIPDIAARLIYRSICHYKDTMYLNLYENHFSYICDMTKYTHSYQCSRCGKYWKTGFQLNRHEKTCEGTVVHKFPGGVYKTPPSIFTQLDRG